MTRSKPSVFVFCALPCEAKPLIKAWRLSGLPSADHPFSIYAGLDRVVVVTGMGKVGMAGAIGYVLALFDNPESPILINLGIAGHRSEVIGTLCLGHKIIDKETGRCFYPQMPFDVNCSTYEVVTHGQPHTDYRESGLYDMEAAGFYELAVKFSSSELIQVAKIVSDNMHSSVANIRDRLVEEWVERQLDTVGRLVVDLIGLRSIGLHEVSVLYQQLIERFHFTVSRALKLKALLHRWRLLRGGQELTLTRLHLRNAEEVLSWLECQLDEVEFYL